MSSKERTTPRPDLSTKLAANNPKNMTPGTVGDDSTWDDTRTDAESSYGTSLVSGSSYTDHTSPTSERNSRRALILQMAKARMKNVKEQTLAEKNAPIAAPEPQGEEDKFDAPQDEFIGGGQEEYNDDVDEVAGLEGLELD